MTAQLPSRERLEQYANDPRMCNVNDEIRAMARALLAAHEQEPVGEVIEMCGGLIMDGVINLDSRTYREISGVNKMKRMPLGTKFYTHPAPVPAVPDVGTAHSSIIAEQLEHVLSSMDVTDHQRAVITCAVDRLNSNAKMLQKAPYSPAAKEAILYEPIPTDSANAPLKFTDVEDRAWVIGAEWMRDAFKRDNPHLRIANDDDPAPQAQQGLAAVPGDFDAWFDDVMRPAMRGIQNAEQKMVYRSTQLAWNACRAAMLNGGKS